MRDVGPPERNVAMVFQNLALFPHMTALDNVRFPLVERKIEEATIQARVAEETQKLHMAHILHKPPAQLSGGERQRVAVVRSLINEPKLLLADEPTGALAEDNAANLIELLVELNESESLALIVVTHDRTVAESVGSIKTLNRGKIETTS